MTGTRPAPGGNAPLDVTALMHGPLALTPLTIVIVTANTLVFAAMLAHGAGLWHTPNHVQLAWGAGFGPATRDGGWWRLGTAMFLHFGLVHLAVNMWALWDGGRLVERLYGPVRFAAVFFASGLCGNLLSLVVHGDRAVSGGASSAIFGIYGALLVWLWRKRRHVHPTDFRWLFGGASAFTAATIGFGLLISGVDNAAHVGGLVAGALLGIVLAPDAGGSNGRRFAAGTLVIAVAALVARVPPPAYRWHDEEQAREQIRAFLEADQRLGRQWQSILDERNYGSASFDQIAGRIESDVTQEYQQIFDQLSALNLDPAAPSATAVETLRRYAQLRAEAAHALAEALRTQDRRLIDAALEMARRAPYLARGMEAPPPPPPQPPLRQRDSADTPR